MGIQPGKVEHLYVHVPFCAVKCNYCAFYSEAGGAGQMADYVEAVIAELEGYCRASAPLANCGAGGPIASDPTTAGDAPDLQTIEIAPKTVFFGGGTPSLLPTSLMRRILDAVGRACRPGAPLEWTIECNPSTVSTDKARLFREVGVNRISMGVQALDDELLQKIGRVHSVTGATKSYDRLRQAGFQNINLDLMFGLPGQTMKQWKRTLAKAIELQPEHVSTYCLILEEDTPFWSLSQQGLIKPDEELELAMYEAGIETLTGAGYRQYEISNFAKPGRECAHNIAYWEAEDYIGLGPSACSTVGDKRWQNAPDTGRYVESLVGRAIQARRPPLAYEEPLTPRLRAAERAAFGMRMNAGVPAELLRNRWDKQVAELLSADLVQWSHGRLQPTKRGILFADEVASYFV